MSDRFLLDASVLIALSFSHHIHHERTDRWFEGAEGIFATCPITQGALVRFALRQPGADSGLAQELLEKLTSQAEHEFWPDDVPFSQLPWARISGHRQVTDAYLVTLARHHRGRLVTLDESLATVFPDAMLLPA